MKKTLALVLVVALLTPVLPLLSPVAAAPAALELVVGPNPGEYTTIQEAVEAAPAGAVIKIRGGVYAEEVQIGSTSEDSKQGLTLCRFSRRDQVRIEGGVVIQDPEVTLQGMTISAGAGWGVYVWQADGCVVRNNVLKDCGVGLGVVESNSTLLWGNRISNCEYGAYVRGSANRIMYNSFWDCTKSGVQVFEGKANRITVNLIRNCAAAITLSSKIDWGLPEETLVRFNLGRKNTVDIVDSVVDSIVGRNRFR